MEYLSGILKTILRTFENVGGVFNGFMPWKVKNAFGQYTTIFRFEKCESYVIAQAEKTHF